MAMPVVMMVMMMAVIIRCVTIIGWTYVVMLLDDHRGRNISGCGRSDVNWRTTDGRVLHRRDSRFAHAIPMQHDDVANFQPALNSVFANVIHDYVVTETVAGHGNHIRRRNGARNLVLPLLFVGLDARFLLHRVPHNGAGHQANSTADQSPGSRIAVVLANRGAGERTANAA